VGCSTVVGLKSFGGLVASLFVCFEKKEAAASAKRKRNRCFCSA
jgi:hypothetical protein